MNCEMFQIVTNCRVIVAYVMQRRPLTYVTFPAVLPVSKSCFRHRSGTGPNAIKPQHVMRYRHALGLDGRLATNYARGFRVDRYRFDANCTAWFPPNDEEDQAMTWPCPTDLIFVNAYTCGSCAGGENNF